MAVFDWSEYLIFAKEIQETRQDEAALRSAVSRAYYAAFHHARAYCAANGIDIPESTDNTSHKVVWDRLQNISRTVKGAYLNGTRLKRKRHDADYVSEVPNLSAVTEQAIHESDLVFSYLPLRTGA
jgi:uncharacterized protein (UPF0332 family)